MRTPQPGRYLTGQRFTFGQHLSGSSMSRGIQIDQRGDEGRGELSYCLFNLPDTSMYQGNRLAFVNANK